MKKILPLLLAGALLLSFVACNAQKDPTATTQTAATTKPEPPDDTPLYNEDFAIDFSKYLTVPALSEVKLSQKDLDEKWELTALQIRKNFATYSPTEEGYTAADGDKVNIHYKGYAANESDSISEETLSRMTNFRYDDNGNLKEGDDLVLGSGTMIGAYESEAHPEKNNAGFEEQLIDMKAGETRTITVTFPDNYGSDELNGTVVCFDVTVNEVEKGELPALTDEMVATYTSDAYPTADSFREFVQDYYKGQLAYDAMDAAAIIHALPTNLVDKEITQYIYEYIEYIHPNEELTDEETKVIFDEQYDNAKIYAEDLVRAQLILELLFQRYEIVLTWGEYKEMRAEYFEQDFYLYFQYYGITTEEEYEEFIGKDRMIQQCKFDKLLELLKQQAVFE